MTRHALLLAWLLAACAGATPGPSEPGAGPATCRLVRVDQVTRESDQDADSLVLTAVYSPPGATAEDQGGIEVEVQAVREREDDVRARLQANPEPLCRPEPGAPGGYRVQLPL